jgi:hypothetical protein
MSKMRFLITFSSLFLAFTNAHAAKVVGTPTTTNMNFGHADVTFYGSGSGSISTSSSGCTNSGSTRLFAGTGCVKATVTVQGNNNSSGSSTNRRRFRVFRNSPVTVSKGSETMSVTVQLPTSCTGSTPGSASYIDCDFPSGTGPKSLTINVFGTLNTTADKTPGSYVSSSPFISVCSCSNSSGNSAAACPNSSSSKCYTF